ncbi:MAG: helix-turn-helix domain-containing protein [Lachnospiraceae bacterium]|nr:helix-turn-helix domain-containing protein [Lachnospiraceae bacterium]
MNINSYILKEELPCLEDASIKSSLYDLPLTNCLIWEDGLPLLKNYIYITKAAKLEKFPEVSFHITVISIGKPSDQILQSVQLDILWVKDFIPESMLLSMNLKILYKYQQYTEQLTDICNRNSSDEELNQFLISVFANPIIVLGTYWEIFAIFQNEETYHFPQLIREKESDFLSPQLENFFRKRTQASHKSNFIELTPEGIPFANYNLYCNGEISLRLYLMGIINPITDRNRIMLFYTSRFLEYRKSSLYFNSFQGMHFFQQKLLRYSQQDYNISEDVHEHMEIEKGLNAIGWKTKDCYIGIVARTLNSLPLMFSDFPESDLLKKHSIMLYMEKKCFFICNLTRLGHSEQWIIDYLEEARKNRNLTIGIGAPFHNFYDFPNSCKQSEAAIQIGREINDSRNTYPFRDYGLDYIITEGCNTLPLNTLLYGDLKDMISYDKIHHTQYCITLKAYFQNYMNMAQTAKILHIHISTLKYRLTRISELLNLDLDDPANKMYLRVVMYLLE